MIRNVSEEQKRNEAREKTWRKEGQRGRWIGKVIEVIGNVRKRQTRDEVKGKWRIRGKERERRKSTERQRERGS